jgi:hypothetical protein
VEIEESDLILAALPRFGFLQFRFRLDSSVSSYVIEGETMSGKYTSDQQPSMTGSRVFLAAHNGDFIFLTAVL